jgi:RNA polymerase sigma-70 factor, ECF subfamily
VWWAQTNEQASVIESRTERLRRFERLFAAQYAVVAAYANRRASAVDADDAVAETFLVAWRRLDDVPDDAKPWLLGVARRVLANQRRAARRRDALYDRAAASLTATGDAVDTQVLQALAPLSERDREILLLAAWEGLTMAEAAVVLGCSRAAAKVRLHRAKHRLREELARLQGERPATTTRLEECHEE